MSLEGGAEKHFEMNGANTVGGSNIRIRVAGQGVGLNATPPKGG